jgi:uncharacterized RDD family membrane protein YckC
MNAMAPTSASALSGSKLDNRRMLAALIDLAIVGAGGAAVLVAAGVLGGDGTPLGAPLVAVVVGWALYYWFACETGGGQTVGKKVTRVRVVRLDGRPAGMREIAVRTVLRVVDTPLVGLIAMLATGERRARLGDLGAGTKIVSADGAAGSAASQPVAVAAAPVESPAESEPVAAAAEEAAPLEDPVQGEPVAAAAAEVPAEEAGERDEPDAHVDPVAAAAEAPGEEAGEGIEPDAHVEPVVAYEPITREEPAEEPAPDIATPTLKELAKDVAAVAGSAPDPAAAEPDEEAAPAPALEVGPEPEPGPIAELEPRPVAEVEIGGPEIDVDDPQVTVRSVETVSAIDLVMGDDEPPEDRPAADPPPAGA